MDFRILGSLEVWEGERQLELGGPKRRAVLAFLLLHANEVVAVDRLVDQLWGEKAPRNAAGALHTHVSRLRKELGAEVVATRAWGYVLRSEAGALDLERFEGLSAEAENLPARERAAMLREALALWRGPPLEDLAFEPGLAADLVRLEELRLTVLENRIDADLEAGNHAGLVGELEALIAEHPLRERLRGQLILALYRSGRQAEALEVYRETRRVLADELGLEPSPELRELERAILQHDPALRASPVSTAVAAEPGVRPGRRRRVFIRASLALLLVGLGAATAYAVSTRTTQAAGGDPTTSLTTPTSTTPTTRRTGTKTSPSVDKTNPVTTTNTHPATSTTSTATVPRNPSHKPTGHRITGPALVTLDLTGKRANLGVGLKGWGRLKFAHLTLGCVVASCVGRKFAVSGRLVVFTESEPWPGWKFTGWQGACRNTSPQCVVDFAHVPRDAAGVRYTYVRATFTPVGPGLTRGNPIPLGTAGHIPQGFDVRVNSVTPNTQGLSETPPPGAEYFVANVTVTYTGGGSGVIDYPWQVIGSHNTTYTVYGRGNDNSCPSLMTAPLNGRTLYSGQSITGNVCWEIATDDESSLELYFGSGFLNYPGTTWFALHAS